MALVGIIENANCGWKPLLPEGNGYLPIHGEKLGTEVVDAWWFPAMATCDGSASPQPCGLCR